jgi:chemotaxis protein MotB
MALRRRSQGEALNPWPGYVDALSTLLMVIIFVLLVFVLAQAFLSVALSGRDRQLDRVNRQMAELTDMLSLERGRTHDLQLSISQLNRDLQTAVVARDALTQQLTALRTQSDQIMADRDSLKANRDRLSARLADADLQAQSARARTDQLQSQLADLARRNDSAGQTAATASAQLTSVQRQGAAMAGQLADVQQQLAARDGDLQTTQQQLAAAQKQLDDSRQQLADMRDQMATLNKTVQVDRDTITARLSDLAKMTEQARALAALRDDLERQAQDAAVRATTEQQRREAVTAALSEEKKFGDSARAQIALLTQQRLLWQATRGSRQPAGHPGGRRSLRVSERSAVSGRQCGSHPGGAGPDPPTRDDAQGNQRRDPAGCELAAEGGRPR